MTRRERIIRSSHRQHGLIVPPGRKREQSDGTLVCRLYVPTDYPAPTGIYDRHKYLARDPELRALDDAAGRIRIPGVKHPQGMQALEVKTLNRTRRLLARKSFVLGIALLFTCLPMTTVFQKGKSVLVLARDYPDAAFGLLLNAVIAWIVYLDTCRRLRATGLEGPPGYSRLLWALVGLALGVPGMLVAQHWAGGQNWPIAIPPLFTGLAFVLGDCWARMARRIA